MNDRPRPQVRRPQQARSEATRERIVAAGKLLMSRDGYHNTSSKKIAAKAGVSIGSFYNYFVDKKQLLIEVQRRHMREVHEVVGRSIAETLQQAAPLDEQTLVSEVIDQALRAHDLSPELHREIESLVHTDPDLMAIRRDEERATVQMLQAILEAHGPRPQVDDLEAACWTVTATIETVIHRIKMGDSPIDETRLRHALAQMVQRFLYPRSS